MIFRKFATKKLTKAAEVMIEPAKKAVQDQVDAVKKAVGDKSDWGAKLFKFILGGLFVIFAFRDDRQQNPPQRLNSPTPNIVINNYINKEGAHDYKYQRDTKDRSNNWRHSQNGNRFYTRDCGGRSSDDGIR